MEKLEEGSDNRKNSWYATQSHCYDQDLLAGVLGSTAAIRKFDSETWRPGTGLAGQALRSLESGIGSSDMFVLESPPYGLLAFISDGMLSPSGFRLTGAPVRIPNGGEDSKWRR
jgi:hypothetical protein